MRPSVTPALVLLFATAVSGCDRASTPAEQAEAPRQTDRAAPARPSSGKLDETHRGEAMPSEAIIAPNGTPTTLASLQGRPVLVNLWATWCGPCVAEMPTLVRLAAREKDRLAVVIVSQDAAGADLNRFLDRAGATSLPSYRDPENGLGFAYNSGLLPTTILYDAQGRELWRMVGGYEWDSPAAAQLVERAL
ncbi:thiol-disulfide isomerase/thioredoxin [Sphingomonas jejuensis]|uniref:Thiol-disulfide isomerase/thioredoxin n=1 Tax=Sphingomonas jejuensis TaxID=904715 RepID=A0ABX0XNX3_9SPHN|nr:TlpA disulfide reductase family protein [Sphingomonas jejuensis]NJC34975.1 thiol-disulfide isomerase/thioredoxin [Sphingomonas jejuensis]